MPVSVPSPEVQKLLDNILGMDEAFKQPSCNSKLPFVEYPSTGTPPVISFNVPQSTAFTTYGHILKYFPPTYFKPFTKQVPANNYYDMVKNMNQQQAVQLFQPIAPVRADDYPTVMLKDVGPGIPVKSLPGNLFVTAPLSANSTVNPTALTVKQVQAGPGAYKVTAVPDVSLKADYAMQQLRPLELKRINGIAPVTQYVAKPPVPVPRLVVIEEYTTVSFLGNYGAGRVVKTMSLFPGEQTTISVRTYKDMISTTESSKNVLDSFSESAAKELDTLMQHEQGDMSSTSDTSGGSSSSFSTSTDTKNSSKSWGISGSIGLGPVSIGGGYGRSSSEMSTSSSGMAETHDYSHTGIRQQNVNSLSSAINKSVQQSNANRMIDVNTSTSNTARSGEEEATVRQLKNVNLNNTLNITFRQLLQEYTVITYLSNVKFAYTNGYPESYTLVDLNNLPNMLADIIDTTNDPDAMKNVLCKLLNPYCNVLNYDDDFKQFVEKIPVPASDCLGIGGNCHDTSEMLYRIKKDLEDKYTDGVVDFKVRGVILKVQKQTLQTSSLIADALLGRGDALDCFNQKAQTATNDAAFIANLQSMQILNNSLQISANDQLFATQQLDMGAQKMDLVKQQLDLVDAIPDSLEKAKNYKKVFGECCDVPQSCCGGGCGCDCNDTPPTP